ncbi:hypothetical protein GCM10027347_44460 [Larkinella harenae]
MTPEQKYKIIRMRHEISEDDMANWFGYKNTTSFRNAKQGRSRLIAGVVKLYEKLNGEIV